MIDLKYLFDKYGINCTGILHVGASTGQERDTYAELNIPEVLWIEAIPFVFAELKENLLPYQNQIAIKACISDVDNEEVVFNISNNEAQSSSFLELGTHTEIHPEVHYIEQIKLETIRLDSLFNLLERDIKHINFGNFDLQGCELKALKSLGKIINQFDYFYLEVNQKETYKGCALVWEIDEFLSDFGRVETGEWVGGCWSDALYVRRSLL